MRVRADEAEFERRDRPPPSGVPVRPDAAKLLALQASAGNAAVVQTLARYESGEHAQMATGKHSVTIKGVTLTESDLAALGDLYETADELYAADATELKPIVDLIRRDKDAFEGVAGKKKVTNPEWEAATKGRPANKRYLELAKRNDPHFAPPGKTGDHKSEFEKWHLQALQLAIEEGAKGGKVVPEKAVAINGFGTSSPTRSRPATSLPSRTR